MSGLPTWRDAVHLRLIKMSPGKAYIPELSCRGVLEKQTLVEQKHVTSSEESPDCSSPYWHSETILWSDKTLFPGCIILKLKIPLGCSRAMEFTFTENLRLPLGVQKFGGKTWNAHTFACILAEMLSDQSHRAAANLSPHNWTAWEVISYGATICGRGCEMVPKRTYHHLRQPEEIRIIKPWSRQFPSKSLGPVSQTDCSAHLSVQDSARGGRTDLQFHEEWLRHVTLIMSFAKSHQKSFLRLLTQRSAETLNSHLW